MSDEIQVHDRVRVERWKYNHKANEVEPVNVYGNVSMFHPWRPKGKYPSMWQGREHEEQTCLIRLDDEYSEHAMLGYISSVPLSSCTKVDPIAPVTEKELNQWHGDAEDAWLALKNRPDLAVFITGRLAHPANAHILAALQRNEAAKIKEEKDASASERD